MGITSVVKSMFSKGKKSEGKKESQSERAMGFISNGGYSVDDAQSICEFSQRFIGESGSHIGKVGEWEIVEFKDGSHLFINNLRPMVSCDALRKARGKWVKGANNYYSSWGRFEGCPCWVGTIAFVQK
jgi:hypothetical protein